MLEALSPLFGLSHCAFGFCRCGRKYIHNSTVLIVHTVLSLSRCGRAELSSSFCFVTLFCFALVIGSIYDREVYPAQSSTSATLSQ